MENAHSQIDQLINNNTLKDFLIASTQDKYSTLAPQKVYTSGYNKSLEKNILDAYKNMYRKKSIDALQYSQGRKANLNNLNLKNLPGNIQIGDKIRPQFGGPLVAAVTMAPLIQELIYMMMGLDAEGLENQPPEFPHLEVGSSVETAFPSGPSRIEPIKLK